MKKPSLSLLCHVCMDSLVFLFLFSITLFHFPSPSISGQVYSVRIPPNFTASQSQYIDSSGTFLYSKNQTFMASFASLATKTDRFYFSVIHVRSNTIIWTANRNTPTSLSDKLSLTDNGLSIYDGSNRVVWSTPSFGASKVSVMILQDSGNLVLFDKNNVPVWESFDYATDTIVIGQRLRIDKSLVGSIQEDDLSESDYEFVVSDNDAILQWKGITYWKLSMDVRAHQDSPVPVLFMELNADGFYFFGNNGSVVVFKVSLAPSDFRIAKLESNGMFNVKSFMRDAWSQEFKSPSEDCRVPLICGKIKLCNGERSCSCPQNFRNIPDGCAPTDASLSLYSGCNGSLEANASISYQKLGNGIDYFSNGFTSPTKAGISLSDCKDLCTKNCSCLGLFYANSSDSCYILEENLGSLMSATDDKNDRVGYVKAIVVSSPANDIDDGGRKFPIAGLVLLPSSGFFLLVVFVYWRRNNIAASCIRKLGHSHSYSSSELEIISVSGLPIRFEYEELEVATENFRTKIGSGGFGTVYKGTLSDTTTVAVKKMNKLGVQGKKEFCTEIAIIGNVHHVNLVKLKGFCAQRKQWFLVYEYMNRGSLDCELFGEGPVLEWKERFEIALGAARGLAYLHTWCEQKIIHCDVKPENILLHDNLQVKITDFGISKLLSPEQSALFTTMRGTRGYLAPEWLTGAMISDKADVYSYGMVLLEIVRGKKNYSQSYNITKDKSEGTGSPASSSGSESRLVYFPLFALKMHEKKKYLRLADPRLQGRVTSEEIEKLVRIALCCLHEDPIFRPAMANVVAMLEGTMPLAEPKLDSLNFLRFCGRNYNEPFNVEGSSNEQNIFARFAQEVANYNSTTSDSYNSLSYISSQQVSGPR